jgi:hypothetical protein
LFGSDQPPGGTWESDVTATDATSHRDRCAITRHDNALVVLHDFESFSVQIGDFDGGAS